MFVGLAKLLGIPGVEPRWALAGIGMGAMSIGTVEGMAGIGAVDRGLVGIVGSEDGWELVGKVELRNG